VSILYLLTAPPPPFAGTDAVQQDIDVLRCAFGAKILNLSPLNSSTRRFPKQLFGVHRVRELRRLERHCKINHIFFSMLYPFPILRLLRNPVFYTVTGSLDAYSRPRGISRLSKLAAVIVSNERDARIVKGWGLGNCSIVPPGLDVSTLRPRKLALGRELTLLMASAPWIAGQFEDKGIDLLLQAVARLPYLRLILLWRGVLADELARRVAVLRIGDRFEIVDRKVDISSYFARVHATVLLAKRGGVVKSFPHSLLESLFAGKPVLLSNTIAMSEYVSGHGCGVVVDRMELAAVAAAIDILMRDYEELSFNAAQSNPAEFSVEAMIENHRRLYAL
jgi:glycosyltransferase involved in cell wall biosynthesis